MTSTFAPVGRAALTRTPARSTRRSAFRVNAVQAAPDKDVVPTSVYEYAKTLPGISEPFPNIFDPANLLARAAGSARPVQELRRWRESEITHGRVSMLAALGFIVGEQVPDDFPLFPHVTGPAIVHFQQVEAKGAIFWEPLVFAIGLAEAYRVSLGWATPTSSNFNTLRDDYEPGNLGFDPLGLLPSDPKERYDMQTKELNNGRLAMIAIAAFVAQELVEKKPIFANLFPAIENEAALEVADLIPK